MAYSQKVVDRFESVLNNPQKHSVGRFDPKDPNVATGMVGAPACGDVMKLQLKLIRFGQKGAKTAGKPKAGESARMKAKRKSFKARHAKNIAKGKMSAAWWADKVKW